VFCPVRGCRAGFRIRSYPKCKCAPEHGRGRRAGCRPAGGRAGGHGTLVPPPMHGADTLPIMVLTTSQREALKLLARLRTLRRAVHAARHHSKRSGGFKEGSPRSRLALSTLHQRGNPRCASEPPSLFDEPRALIPLRDEPQSQHVVRPAGYAAIGTMDAPRCSSLSLLCPSRGAFSFAQPRCSTRKPPAKSHSIALGPRGRFGTGSPI
jgi:hypothetical protein